MPTANTSEENQVIPPIQRNTIIDRLSTASSAEVRESAVVEDIGNSNCSLTSDVNVEQIGMAEWPGPKPSDVTTGSTMDNYKFFRLDIIFVRCFDSSLLDYTLNWPLIIRFSEIPRKSTYLTHVNNRQSLSVAIPGFL